MIDINIDDFYHDMAVILLSLYQQFPQKTSLYVEDICGPDDADEYGLHSKRYLSSIGALMWLQDEGYIRYSDIIKQESAEDCTITQKGFLKLIKPIEQTSENTDLLSSAQLFSSTLIQNLHQTIKEKSGLDTRLLIEKHFLA